jgi:hypothetical protein
VPLLDPDGVKARVASFVQLASPLLRELVNYSSHAYIACMDGMRERVALEEALATMRLHLHIIEMADAVDVLLRDGCGQGALGLGRGAFEASLALTAIHAHTDFQEASLAWLVGSLRREIRTLEDMKEILVADGLNAATQADRLRGLGAAIEALNRKLTLPTFEPIAKRVTDDKWFRPLYGVGNQRDLSAKLDRILQERSLAGGSSVRPFLWRKAYGVFYGRWSSALHGSNWKRVLVPGDDGEATIPEVRLQQALPEVIQMVAAFTLEGTRQQVHLFRPDQEPAFAGWYAHQVRERFLRLTELPVSDW